MGSKKCKKKGKVLGEQWDLRGDGGGGCFPSFEKGEIRRDGEVGGSWVPRWDPALPHLRFGVSLRAGGAKGEGCIWRGGTGIGMRMRMGMEWVLGWDGDRTGQGWA